MAAVPSLDLNKPTDYGTISFDSDSDEEYDPENYDDDGSDSDIMPEQDHDEEEMAKETELFDEYDYMFGPEGTMAELYTEDASTGILAEDFFPRPQGDDTDSSHSSPSSPVPDDSAQASETAPSFPQPPSPDGVPTPTVPQVPLAAAASAPAAASAAAQAGDWTRKIHVFLPSKWTKTSTLLRIDGLPELDENGKPFNAAKLREVIQGCLQLGKDEKINCRLTYPHEQRKDVPVPHLGWGVLDVMNEEEIPQYIQALHGFAWNGSTFSCTRMPYKNLGEILEDNINEAGDYQYIMDRKSRTVMPAWLRTQTAQHTPQAPRTLAGAPPTKHKGIQKGQIACGKVLEILKKFEGWDAVGEEGWTVNNSVIAILDFETAYVGRDYIKPVEVGGVIGRLASGIENEFGTLMHPGGIKELHTGTAAHVSLRVPTCVPYKNCTALRLDYGAVWSQMNAFLESASFIVVKGLENHVDRHALKWLCAAACVGASPEQTQTFEAQRDQILAKFIDYMALYRALEAVNKRNTATEDKIVAGTDGWAGRAIGLCEWAKSPVEFDQRTGPTGVETLLGRDSKNYLYTQESPINSHCCAYHKKFLEIQVEWETTVHCAQRDAALSMKALLHAVRKEFPSVSPNGVHKYKRGKFDFDLEMCREHWNEPMGGVTQVKDLSDEAVVKKWSTNVSTPVVQDCGVWEDNGPNGWGENAQNGGGWPEDLLKGK